MRYSPKKKSEVVAFVHAYNQKHGRGGQSRAVKKYGITALTISGWLNSAQLESSAISGSLKSKVAQLKATSSKLHKLNEESAKLKQKHDALLASILSDIK